VAVIVELLATAWESVTLGEVAIWAGLAGGGAVGTWAIRWSVRALQASTRALEAVTRHFEASTAAARAGARLAPLAAEAMACYIRHRNGTVPVVEEDSDQVRVLRVAAEGDDDELERVAELLAKLPPGATLPTSVGRAVRRLVQLEQDAQRRRGARRDEDAPRARDRTRSWPWAK
jgi:hypothetical protein